MSVNETYHVKAGIGRVELLTVAGVTTVTQNETGAEDINALWHAFFETQASRPIPKVDDTIYAVYSDYEGDHTKPYRVTIGYAVDAKAQLEDLHIVEVASGDYAILSAAGEQPHALMETWKAIWASDLDRNYVTDFEVYGPRFFQDGLHEVLVNIGLRSLKS